MHALQAYDHVQVDEHYQKIPYEAEKEHACGRPEKALVERSRSAEYDFVIPGSESGVSAADWLANELGLPCNRPDQLWHRRNKQGMIEAAAQAGLKVPQTWSLTSAANLSQVLGMADELHHGVIVKPAESGGSDSCFICRDQTEVRNAVEQVLGSTNLFGTPNHEVLVQERIGGEQYFVNAVSARGRHLITEMFHYGINEESATPHIYSAQTISRDNPLFSSGTRYVLELLDALGVQFGASHTEIRFDDNQWTLIEYNGRSMGPMVPSKVYVPARGFSQITILATCLVEGFDAALASISSGSPDYCVGWHMPTPRRSGQLQNVDWSPVSGLSSFVGAYNEPAIGTDFVIENRVTTASAGLLFFSHPTTAQVQDDISRSVALEDLGAFYSLA